MTSLLLIAVALGAAVEPPALRLRLDAGLPCKLNSSLYRALTEQQLKIAASKDPSAWVLALSRDGNAVSMRVANPHGVVRGARRLSPTAADCAALPRTVALLARSWLALQLGEPVRPPPPAPAPPTRVEPRPRRSVELPAPAPVIEQPSVAAPAPEIVFDLPSTFASPPAAEFEVELPAPRPSLSGPTDSLSVLVAGGGAAGPDDFAVAMGMLAVEWGFLEPWGVAIDVGLQSERLQALQGGSVAVSLRWATLSVRRVFFADGIQGLHVSAGIQLVHLLASAHGYTRTTSRHVILPAAVANLEWRQPVAGGFFLLARASVQVRLPQFFTITNVGTLLTLPPLGFGLQAGVGWNFS